MEGRWDVEALSIHRFPLLIGRIRMLIEDRDQIVRSIIFANLGSTNRTFLNIEDHEGAILIETSGGKS